MAGKKNEQQNRSKSRSKSERADLLFPAARVKGMLKKGRYADRIGDGAAVYLTGVLEYLSAEILELAGDASKLRNRVRITPRDITMAVQCDAELKEVFSEVIIPQGGVAPHINLELLKKPKDRKRPKVKPIENLPKSDRESED